jgi:hypothetical protein
MRTRLPRVFRQALWVAVAACGGRVGSDLESSVPGDDAGELSDVATVADAAPHDAVATDSAVVDVARPDAGTCTTVEGTPDAPLSCAYQLTLTNPDACEWSEVRNEGSPAQCARLCGNGVTYCQRIGNKVECQSGCIGRVPAGLERDPSEAVGVLGRYFADAAQLERASVDAFRIAKAELEDLGAPRSLVRACGRAARDEIRHARVTKALARHYGGRPGAARVRRGARRTLEQIAIENAVEGSVRETFGALVAMYQADHAGDPRVRAIMARIARDETNHAALSWRIAQFVEARLSRAARDRVRHARRDAVDALAREVREAPPRGLAVAAGLPSPEVATHLLAALRASLWDEGSRAIGSRTSCVPAAS